MSSKEIDCVLVASDLHVLSTFALLRPGFKTEDGNEIGLNKIQHWLWEQFEDCIAEADSLAQGRKFLLVLNGDLIDGNHHRTTEILACEEWEHARAAIYTLEPLAQRARKIAVTLGTQSHTKGFESAIGSQIGAMKDPETGRHSFREFWWQIKGCLCTARHHMPTSSRTYLEASQLSIQLGNAQLTRARSGHPVPQVICAAHRHRAATYTDGNAMFVVTPAWQAPTGRWVSKVVPDALINPGFVWLDWKGKSEGDLPSAHIIVRNPDPPKVTKL